MIFANFKGEDDSVEKVILDKIERVTFTKGFTTTTKIYTKTKAKAVIQMDSGHVLNVFHTEEEFDSICQEAIQNAMQEGMAAAFGALGGE